MSTYHVRLNRATITGSIPSKKSAHRMVSYAGLLKRAYIYLLEHDPSVLSYETLELTRFWRGPKRKSWVREDTCKIMHTSMTYVRNTYFYFTIKQRLCQEKSSFVLIIRFS